MNGEFRVPYSTYQKPSRKGYIYDTTLYSTSKLLCRIGSHMKRDHDMTSFHQRTEATKRKEWGVSYTKNHRGNNNNNHYYYEGKVQLIYNEFHFTSPVQASYHSISRLRPRVSHYRFANLIGYCTLFYSKGLAL